MPKWTRDQVRKRLRNRRKAARRKASLEARLLPSTSGPTGNLHQDSHTLVGYTRDLSETALSVVLSAQEFSGEAIHDPGHQLRVVLMVPGTGGVIMRGVTVRWEPITEAEVSNRYLLVLQITKMGDFDQKRYVDYLRTLK